MTLNDFFAHTMALGETRVPTLNSQPLASYWGTLSLADQLLAPRAAQEEIYKKSLLMLGLNPYRNAIAIKRRSSDN